ncbi:MAG: TraB/GumN family protein [Nitrospirota bacterium]
MNIRDFFLKEKDLRMIWEILSAGSSGKEDRKSYTSHKSYLAGAAHFFPYSFKKSLTRYIENVDTVLLEGPLDENNMNRVVEQGTKGNTNPALEKALDDSTIKEINMLEYNVTTSSYVGTYLQTFGRSHENSLFELVKNQRPWMAFFNIWFYYREKKGWRYKMDLDALKVAEKLGKEIHFLEKIEEQIEALNGIPVDRIANFLKKIDKWDWHTQRYVKYYLRGDIDGLLSGANDFPTYCESIIDKRDPILYERMKPFLEKGNTLAVVGITHIKGIRERLLADGFTMQKKY